MASIYQIDEALRALVDEETGEILDYEAFENLAMERDRKIENVALWVKNLTAESTAIKAEAKALTERAKACDKRAEKLEKYLSDALAGNKFSTPRVSISFRTSRKLSVDPALEERILKATKRSKLYAFLRVKQTEEVDKAALTEAIKQGMEIDGAALIENQNIQIK